MQPDSCTGPNNQYWPHAICDILLEELEMENRLLKNCRSPLIVQRSANLGMQKLKQNLAGDWTEAVAAASVPAVAVGLLRRAGLGGGSLRCSFCSVSLSFRLPLGSLRPSFRCGPLRPHAWLLARFCAVPWRCACVVRCQHGSTNLFATMSCVCSKRGSLRALNSYLLLAHLGPSPRSRAPLGFHFALVPPAGPQLLFLAPPLGLNFCFWASNSLSCLPRSS